MTEGKSGTKNSTIALNKVENTRVTKVTITTS